ncbi:outer membrane lipoprotein-sorting protein [Hyalangium sp.]|uniref:outer membrane lipoprotein-sorting protein n=1 Tax=Hyalangium sp. TaxID=2028555 RepID=UPI002D7263D3|nr:outer membrane lipoprotein-sorting protein [Hyalangium sp.]HYH95625.1 outer membrane lipoprotein-sorting protein [Hyalangium sp.]
MKAIHTAGTFGAVLTLTVSLWSPQAQAQGAPSIDEIIEKVNHTGYCPGNDARGEMTMTIVDGQGRKQTREFSMMRINDPTPDSVPEAKRANYCGNQRYYVYFTRPADVNKTGFLVWKKVGADDDRWLYLPALDLVKRIASADKRTSFVGSNFLYEDISGRHIGADTHELAETTDQFYVIKNTPKEPKDVEFASYKMWVHKKTFVIVKAEFYDKQGKAYREYKAEKVETIQGFPTTMVQVMKDLTTGGYTQVTMSKVKYNVGIPQDIFSERYLRNPPKQYLQ